MRCCGVCVLGIALRSRFQKYLSERSRTKVKVKGKRQPRLPVPEAQRALEQEGGATNRQPSMHVTGKVIHCSLQQLSVARVRDWMTGVE